jgi:uncharacterized protein YbjT (DUF2867 family)
MTILYQATAQNPIRLLVLGATGAVGGEILKLALGSEAVSRVIAPTRRALEKHAKLENPMVDFSAIDPKSAWLKADAVVCALGTTLKAAGSQEAFAKIDRDLPILLAKLARKQGAQVFALNSSLGANLNGNFYLKTKAQAENGIRACQFPSLTIVRPSLIDAERAQSRPAEKLGLIFARTFKPLIPKRYRAVSAKNIAQVLLGAALIAHTGEHVWESESI